MAENIMFVFYFFYLKKRSKNALQCNAPININFVHILLAGGWCSWHIFHRRNK